LHRRPILDDQFQAEQIGKFQQSVDREASGVRFDLGQSVLTDPQLGGQRALGLLVGAPAQREDLSQLGAVGQYLLHGFSFIGMADKEIVSI
jgi:hypothetical protein